MSMKNPLTPTGIEIATYRFVAQHLNHCATAVKGVIIFMLCVFVLVFYIYCQSFAAQSVDSLRSECTYVLGVTGLCFLAFV